MSFDFKWKITDPLEGVYRQLYMKFVEQVKEEIEKSRIDLNKYSLIVWTETKDFSFHICGEFTERE